MFWVLEFDRFSGVAAGGDEASGPLAILRQRCTISTAEPIIESCHELSSNSRASKRLQGKNDFRGGKGRGNELIDQLRRTARVDAFSGFLIP
jgi:hypothetical protein